jgi:K+-transporting ATPase ATPase B chain
MQMPDQHRRDLSDSAPTFHEFSAQTRISGIDLERRRLRKEAADAIRHFAEEAGGSWPPAVSELVALDSDPTKFIAIVETGQQMLMTHRSLTTFGMAVDLAKYFAIMPVALAATYPALHALNVLRLTSPRSAILSAVIFTALIIGPLLLLAVRGVKARAESAARRSRGTLWIYGLAGILLPWVGIKLIDVCLTACRLV